ncbi:Chalcone-flavanone isomerase family protein [Heracleum sosnowskyi]|uniref:Chalcone-flavanone isomerase family protein n=1 Tax=Heracleum sosnowskyi TaxID=360622 RepID=A0AAD8H4Z1_9APIA|nr:Chalcone-flavanone isomerase family protein [Heracleum sosnowskyi]
METPISARRVTRSQALALSGNKNTNIPISKKVEGTNKGAVETRQKTGKQQDRYVLMDISNDSPIVGLAMESLETPSFTVSQKRSCAKKSDTPGSGESLLRGQVKTLLQKVEEVEISNLFGNAKASGENYGLESSISKTVTEIDGQKKEENDESEMLVTRSLLFDFSENSESSCDSIDDCTSVSTYQGSKMKPSSDDDSSVWSIQVNASSKDDEEDAFEDEVGSGKEEDECYDEQEEEDYCDDDAILDDLCEGLSKVSVNGVEFAGRHTRFVYNSDDELEGEEDCDAADEGLDSLANGVLRLKGMPTPKGKHLHFPMDD